MKKIFYFSICMLLAVHIAMADKTINVGPGNSVSPSSFSIVLGEKITFIISGNHNVESTSVPSGASSFNSGSPGSGTYIYTPTVLGTYAIDCVVHGSIMAATFTVTQSGTTPIEEANTPDKISIYPNPTKEKIMVATTQGIKKSELSIKIYDLKQTLVLSQSFTEGICKGGKGKECLCPGLSEIDVSTLSEGLYVVQITDGTTILLSNKLVKQ